MPEELSIVVTADGSKTVYHPGVKENYHSRNGALQESNHVFLNSGLRYYLADKLIDQVAVLEVGFGLGLGFFQQQTQFFKLDEASYYMKFIPVEFNLADILLINLGTLIVCLLVLLIPSILVTKISPVKAIAFK